MKYLIKINKGFTINSRHGYWQIIKLAIRSFITSKTQLLQDKLLNPTMVISIGCNPNRELWDAGYTVFIGGFILGLPILFYKIQ